MQKLLLVGLFLVSLIRTILSYPGAAGSDYDSIVLDFQEDLTTAQVEQRLAVSQQ